MIALLAKDVRILGRSRLLLGLLVVYPVAIALLIGLAISRSPQRPRVAIVDETPPGQTVEVGGRRVPVSRYATQLFDQVESVPVASRSEALSKVTSAEVLAAVVIPSGLVARVGSGTSRGEIEVLYNGDALQQSLVDSQLRAALAQANLGFSEQLQTAAAQAIDGLLKGGDVGVLGAPANLVGLEQIPGILDRVIAHTPPGAERDALRRVADFASFAAQNLAVSKRVLSTVGQPIAIKTTLLRGRRTPLSTFAVVVAVTISLMFVAVLLAAGAVASEREENTMERLLRGLVTSEQLLAEKALLGAACALVVGLAMLAGVSAFVPLDWGRAGLWLAAAAVAALSFAALGVAIGALAREVRAASLLAFILSLPLAFLALVPSGAVGSGLHAAIGAVSFIFPFKASLEALDAAVNRSSPALGGALAHLAGLIVLFGAAARLGLERGRGG